MLIEIKDLPNDINLALFFSRFRKIFIYGAGNYGKTCAKLFAENNISFDGYLVTKKNTDYIEDHPVYSYDQVKRELSSNDCIILAMKKEYQLEVCRDIGDNYSGQYVNLIENKSFKLLFNREFIELIDKLAVKFPTAKSDVNEFANILVIRLDRMGDLIWTSAFFRELRRNYPKSQINVVCAKNNIQLLNKCPYVNRCIGYEYTCDEETGKLSNEDILNRAEEFAENNLRDINYDVVFLPRGIRPMDRMANIYLAVFSLAPIRIAGYYDTTDKVEDWYREIMSELFSVVSEHKYPLHDVEKSLTLLNAIGCNIKEDDTEIWYENNQIVAGMKFEDISSLHNSFDFMIAIGLTSKDPIKAWNPNNYKKLFAKIAGEFSACFLLLGGTEAKEAASVVFDDRYCLDFTGKTNLNDVMQIISVCDLYVGSDTGLKHIAAALKKPVIEISASFPWGDDNAGLSPKHCGAWKTKHVVLSPEKPKSESCARAGYCVSKTSHCINNVSVDSVWNLLSGFFRYYKF